MSVTININNLTLCHKQSGGISMATIPDVCKTPSPGGPVPIPYPNIALAANLAKGTTTVKADGGNMCAKYGSEFSISTGDEPGTLGGVTSGTFKKEATWITYSFDVSLEGKGACRLTDKMFHNHQNTVNMGGLLQAPLDAFPELIELCVIICQCDKEPVASASGESDLKEKCVELALNTAHAAGQMENMRPEIPYNMTTNPPTPLLHRLPGGGTGLGRTDNLPTRMIQEGLKSAQNNGGVYQVRIPDVVISRAINSTAAGSAASLTAPNLKAVVEIKFNNQTRDPQQIADYGRIAGSPNRVVELNPRECMCNAPNPLPVLVRATDEEKERRLAPQAVPVRPPVPVPQPAPAPGGIFDLDTWAKITGLTGGALVLYLVISEGSRLFPPRNLVPVP
ncbi:MAG TPA: PAAR-like domain-containing protein [Gemmatimonadaceae bacterium]|jgi:hypothetical protein